MATDLGKVVTRLQLERGEVAFYIYTNGSMLKSNLTQRYATTDEAINNMTTWTEIIVPASPNGNTDDEGEVMLNKTSFQMRLNDFRTQIHSEENNNTVFEVRGARKERVVESDDWWIINLSDVQAMLWYQAVNNAMLDHLTNQIKESDKSGIWRWVAREFWSFASD